MPRKKYLDIVKELEARIRHGDYALTRLPAERQLAKEFGVCHNTARKAVMALIEHGLLTRNPENHRGVLNRQAPRRKIPLQIALASFWFSSGDMGRWVEGLSRFAKAHGGILRPVYYTHWNDPLLKDALRGFDVVFLYPLQEVPKAVGERLRHASAAVTLIGGDYTQAGFTSLRLAPAQKSLALLLEHLHRQGHRRVDVFCPDPHPAKTEQLRLGKIEAQRFGLQWRCWVSEPQAPTEFDSKRGAIVLLQQWLALPAAERGTALLVTSMPPAIAIMRGLADAGLRPGRDVALCVMDGEGENRWQVPTVTATEPVLTGDTITACVDWLLAHRGQNSKPRLFEPAEVGLFLGESTALPPPRGRRQSDA
ncbi:MAG: GntR family transcriptional regulator [Lentisphaeria bacterium]